MASFKQSIEEQNILLRYLLPECEISKETYSVFDAILDTPKSLCIIEFKRRMFDSGKYNTLMIERKKLKALVDYRKDLSKTIDRPITLVYMNVLNDKVYYFNIDTIIKHILAKTDTVTKQSSNCPITTSEDLNNSGVVINKVTYLLNISLAFKVVDIDTNKILNEKRKIIQTETS